MFEIDNIYIDFEAITKEELFEKMNNIFLKKGYVKDGYLESIIKREEDYPTGLAFGRYSIAIPHTYYEFVNEEKIVFIRLRNEIKFKEMGGDNENLSVKVVLMLLVNKGERQAELLSYLITKISDENLYNILENSNSKLEIYNILK